MPLSGLINRWRWSSAARVAMAVALTSAAGGVVVVPTAAAGDYWVYGCKAPNGTRGPLDGWMASSSGLDNGSAPTDACTAEGYFGVRIGSYGASLPNDHLAGTWGAWDVVAPAGLSFVSAFPRRTVIHDEPGDPGVNRDRGATPYYRVSMAPAGSSARTPLEDCFMAGGCKFVNHPSHYDSPVNDGAPFALPPQTGRLRFEVGCHEWGESSGVCRAASPGRTRSELRLYGVTLLVRDPSKPRAESVTGTAVGVGAHKGVESARVRATDTGSGVLLGRALIDGVEVSRGGIGLNAGSCKNADTRTDASPEYFALAPCPAIADLNIPVDTTRAADGTRLLTVEVLDASGNTTVAHEQTIQIDNVPPPRNVVRPNVMGVPAEGLRPSDAITADTGSWEGAGITYEQRWQRGTSAGAWIDIDHATGPNYRVGLKDVDHMLRVVVIGRSSEGVVEVASTPTAIVTTGKVEVSNAQPQPLAPQPQPQAPQPVINGGGGNPSTGQLVVDREQRTVEVRHGAKIVVTGRLIDAAGEPIANASVDIFEQLAVTAAPWSKIGTVRTDGQGGYVFRPKTTASRRLRFAFSAVRDAASYRATREVFVSVTAGMSISAKQRTVKRRGLIRLSGKVVVDQLPAKGTWVEVQVLDAGVWRTIATRRASKTGAWSFKHRLRNSALITFTFRARLRVAGDIPSAEAKSKPLKVRVR